MNRDQHPAQAFRDRLRGGRDLPPVGQLKGATPGRVAVLTWLANYADRNLIAAPGVADLADVVGISPSRVRAATAWGVSVGLLERAGGGHRGRAAEWRLLPGPAKALSGERLSGEKGAQKWPQRRSVASALLEELEGEAAAGASVTPYSWPPATTELTSLTDGDPLRRATKETT